MKLSTFLLAASLVVIPASASFGQTAMERQHLNARTNDQQARIEQGARTGQLTPAETARLERQQRNIRRTEMRMRRNNGGRLSRRDRQMLAQRQNRASQHIYSEKHDAQRY